MKILKIPSPLLFTLCLVLLAGCGGSSPSEDAGMDAGVDAGADGSVEPDLAIFFAWQVAGGGKIRSANYSMRVSVGGAPMAHTSSENYQTSIGSAALLSP